MTTRTGSVSRTTKETSIELRVGLDGDGSDVEEIGRAHV